MNITKTNNKSKKIALALIGLLLLIIAIGYTAYSSNLWPFSSFHTEAEMQEAANNSDQTNPQQKKEIPSSETLKSAGVDKTTDEVPVATNGQLDITTLSQQNDHVTYAATLINAKTPGMCSALFEHTSGAARPVTRTNPSTEKGCPETSIPQTEFIARGPWKLTLRYYVDNTQLIATKSFEVK